MPSSRWHSGSTARCVRNYHDYEIKMSVQADDGLGHFLSNRTGLEELHDALYCLGDLATPA